MKKLNKNIYPKIKSEWSIWKTKYTLSYFYTVPKKHSPKKKNRFFLVMFFFHFNAVYKKYIFMP